MSDTIIRTISGTSFARSPVIDPYLEEGEVTKLYEKWDEKWPIEEYSGGTLGITCEHILEVGFSKLRVPFGPKFAKLLVDKAEQYK